MEMREMMLRLPLTPTVAAEAGLNAIWTSLAEATSQSAPCPDA